MYNLNVAIGRAMSMFKKSLRIYFYISLNFFQVFTKFKKKTLINKLFVLDPNVSTK